MSSLKEKKNKLPDYKALMSALPGAHYIIDSKGLILDANVATRKLTGHTTKALIGKNFFTFGLLSKKDIVVLKKNLPLGPQNKKEGPVEVALKRKDKKDLIVEIETSPISLNNKKLTLLTINDISERKETEDELISERNLTRQYLKIAGDILVILDLKGNVTMINEKGSKVLGYKQNEIIGKNWFNNFLPRRSIGEVKAVFKKAIAGELKSVESYDNLVKTKRGDERIISWYNTILEDDGGKIIGTLSSGHDITEEEKAKDSLKESEDEYRILYETSADAIMTLMPPDWRFTAGNPATVKMFGTGTEKKFISLSPGHLSPKYQPDGQLSSEKALKMIMTAMKRGSHLFDWTHKVHNGKDFAATVLLTRIERGDDSFLQATVRNVEKQKRTEEKVRELDKLKSRFITALTHVSRTPLNKIRWGLEMLLSGDFGELTKEQTVFLRQILESEEDILKIINNMNFVLDIERGKVHYQKSSTSLLSLVKSVVQDNEPELKIKGLGCKVETPKTNLPSVKIDQEKIRIVCDALLDNAIKYSRKDKEISINMRMDKKSMIVQVKDQGVGIPSEEQYNIFDRFFRTSNARSIHPNGVGLGLYIAKEIIEGHGGKMGFKSKEGEGSTFWFEIPIN